MEKPKHYWTQFGNTPGELDDLVNERMDEGWELFGDPYFVNYGEKDPLFCQAMSWTRPKATTVSERLRDELT